MMDYSQYEPPIVDGAIFYGEMHAKRKRDAEYNFFLAHTFESEIILSVRCEKRHPLAWVEDSAPHIIVCWQSGKSDSSLQRLNQESEINGIEYIEKKYWDFIEAGDDLDLEVQCNCGGMKILDRDEIRDEVQGALVSGKRTLFV